MAENGCAAVASLACDDADNKKRLKSAGGLDVLKRTMDNEHRAGAINCLT